MVGNKFCAALRKAPKGYHEIKSKGSLSESIGAPTCHTTEIQLCFHINPEVTDVMLLAVIQTIHIFVCINISKRCYSFPLIFIHIYLH